MDYFKLQEDVFNHLWQKHQQDNSFTFSVRQKASKGAESNHFIGTGKSNYFGFTCWDIPVYFPGSSADLTNFIITLKDRCFIRFQYGGMVKTQTDAQSVGDLALGYHLADQMRNAGLSISPYDDKNRILYYYLELNPAGYNSVKEVIDAFEELYRKVAPLVDSSIEAIKQSHPTWQASRYTKARFDTLIQKMHARLARFASGAPLLPTEVEDEPEVNFLSIGEAQLAHPLNTILYGPPGTGKTYNTINKAIAIANPDYILEGRTRKELKQEYSRLCEAKQIQFVTFHQSMSYEDFIEGIKPVEPKEGDPFLKYKVEDGIFKRLVEQAAYVPDVQEASVYMSEDEFRKASFYSLTLNSALMPEDKVIYRYSIDHNCIALNVADGVDVSNLKEADIKQAARDNGLDAASGAALSKFVHHVKRENYVLLCDGDSTCRAIGRVTGDYVYKPNEEITPDHFRDIEWLVKDAQIPREQLYQSPFTYGIERLDKQEVKKDFFTKKTVAVQPALVRKNYVLIIDEINRGNVSQIFGELITLIEEDKRAGRKEALTITLPYSKKPFAVPDNLYIIGTMNTADRSVEALDSALRRRFVFEEMLPKPELLSPQRIVWNLWWDYTHQGWDEQPYSRIEKGIYDLVGLPEAFGHDDKLWTPMKDAGRQESQIQALNAIVFTGVNLKDLLQAINTRLEALLTRDHAIGHAYLIEVKSLPELQEAFAKKVIPLLQEYFYNDYVKIGWVLGEDFFEPPANKEVVFVTFGYSDDSDSTDFNSKPLLRFKKPDKWTKDTFIKVYNPAYTSDEARHA